MTAGTKLHQALAMLETTAGTLHSFAVDTDDAQAKQLYQNYSQQLDQMVEGLKNRVGYVESQEPQYQIDNMIQSGLQREQAMQQQQQQSQQAQQQRQRQHQERK